MRILLKTLAAVLIGLAVLVPVTILLLAISVPIMGALGVLALPLLAVLAVVGLPILIIVVVSIAILGLVLGLVGAAVGILRAPVGERARWVLSWSGRSPWMGTGLSSVRVGSRAGQLYGAGRRVRFCGLYCGSDGRWQSWRDRSCRRDVAQSGSAPEWGSGGRGFESRRPDWVGSPSLLGTSGPFRIRTVTPPFVMVGEGCTLRALQAMSLASRCTPGADPLIRPARNLQA